MNKKEEVANNNLIYKESIVVNNIPINIISNDNENDFISLTDLAKYKNAEFPKDVIKNWMRSRSTIEFLGLWEMMHNPNFKANDFDKYKNDAGEHSFVMTPQKWIESTNAIGIVSRSGNGGGNKNYAQGGGTKTDDIPTLLAEIKEKVKNS